MDRVVGLIVRLMVLLGRFARFLPGIKLRVWQPGERLKILLAGYNGARNTGADVRVSEIARQIEAIFGKEEVSISVMTLDAESMRPYFDDNVELVEFSAIFCLDALRLCSCHHIALLCEGSTLKSKFANALTLFYCEVAGVMKAQGKPCIAYGSEAGDMDPFLKRIARKMFRDVHYIARTQNSLEVVEELGLEGRLGTDTAWSFDSSKAHDEAQGFLRDSGWDGEKPLFGIAPINPFWWPVRPSIPKTLACMFTGNRSLHFQKWYHFSWSKDREAHFQTYLHALADAVNTTASAYGLCPVIIGMERLDEDACSKLNALLDHPAPVVLSKQFDGFIITETLRSLSLLITSRYHAEVLSMACAVPTVAVSMDERLTNLSVELGFESDLLFSTGSRQLKDELIRALEFSFENRERIQERIAVCYEHYQGLMDDMGCYLVNVIDQAFPGLIEGQGKELPSRPEGASSRTVSHQGLAPAGGPCPGGGRNDTKEVPDMRHTDTSNGTVHDREKLNYAR